MTDYEDYNNLAFPPQELSEIDRLRQADIEAQEIIAELKYKLEISVNALNVIIKDYEINGPCEEDCVGFYMSKRVLKFYDTSNTENEILHIKRS